MLEKEGVKGVIYLYQNSKRNDSESEIGEGSPPARRLTKPINRYILFGSTYYVTAQQTRLKRKIYSPKAALVLVQRLQQWPNIKTTLDQQLLFTGMSLRTQTSSIG